MPITSLSTFRWPALVAVLALTQSAGAGMEAGQLPREPHRPIPTSLLLDHAELTASLKAAARVEGPTGAAAREVLRLVEPHMLREQALALTPLRLLPRIVNGEIGEDAPAIVALTERLRLELPALRREHQDIRQALEELWSRAWRDGKPEYAFLAQRLNRHILEDEEVFYPAALLVGDYLRLLRDRRPPTE